MVEGSWKRVAGYDRVVRYDRSMASAGEAVCLSVCIEQMSWWMIRRGDQSVQPNVDVSNPI